MVPAFIDVEASGFGRHSYPIEVGVVLPDRESHCFIISPPTHWSYWDPEAEAVSHPGEAEVRVHAGAPRPAPLNSSARPRGGGGAGLDERGA